MVQEGIGHGAGLGEMIERAGDVGCVKGEGLETGEADRGVWRSGDQQGKQVQASAEAEFRNVEIRAKAGGQVVSSQKDVAGFGKAVVQRKIRVIKAARDGDGSVAPVKPALVDGVQLAYARRKRLAGTMRKGGGNGKG